MDRIIAVADRISTRTYDRPDSEFNQLRCWLQVPLSRKRNSNIIY
ncbi:MAG: hypothetical protein WBA16_12605 [Nonlabens sp.]